MYDDLSFRMKDILQDLAPFHLRRLPDVAGPVPSVTLDKQAIKLNNVILYCVMGSVNHYFRIIKIVRLTDCQKAPSR
ncbi:hypothetical protein AZ46_0222070 [Metabacillus indicus LMG 22858]|uniref:Uncharacterized protein n=1 Tax=Metabacillus indicus TaxID=246786 RepID=A0A084GJD1_METID|nr:hypothetical protein AZ46_0222070 [Metabacillus indicus LMG 22858]KEZ47443.1 hypothetical protein GS18_0221735 [Metabacillus indicus]